MSNEVAGEDSYLEWFYDST